MKKTFSLNEQSYIEVFKVRVKSLENSNLSRLKTVERTHEMVSLF